MNYEARMVSISLHLLYTEYTPKHLGSWHHLEECLYRNGIYLISFYAPLIIPREERSYYIPFAVAGDKLKPVGGPVEDAGDDNNDRLFGVFAVNTTDEVVVDVVVVADDAELVPVTKPW